MHLLDTDMWTHLQRGHPRVVEAMRVLHDGEVGVTVVTWIEVLRGRFDTLFKAANSDELIRAQANLSRDRAKLAASLVVDIDERASATFDQLRRIKGLKKIGRGDLLIASITLAHDAVLATRNLRHFRQVPRLRLVNWID
jgi:tRNA(fMet)-specific endonuclease VapC